MKTNFFKAFVGASVCASAILAALNANPAFAQTPARTDKIMTLAELRTCMKLEQSNKKSAAEILQEQATFKRDQDAVKADQAEVGKVNDDVRARSAVLNAERFKSWKPSFDAHNSKQAVLAFNQAGQPGAALVTLQLYADTRLLITHAQLPRFRWSNNPDQITLNLEKGRVRVDVDSSSRGKVALSVHTPHLSAYNNALGSFNIEVLPHESRVCGLQRWVRSYRGRQAPRDPTIRSR